MCVEGVCGGGGGGGEVKWTSVNIVMNLDCFVSILVQCTHVYVSILYGRKMCLILEDLRRSNW